MNNVIFDVGANNGVDGLGYALLNKKLNIYAFEANPDLIKIIQNNKEKIELFFNIKLNNYTIVDKAVSNFVGREDFYISEYDLCSSLLKYKFVKTKQKISCEVITLKKFCDENDIDNIIYLHTDTQGSDLDVLKGLEDRSKIVHSGVIETMIKQEDIKYIGASSLEEFEKFFLNNDFKIIKKIFNDPAQKEINVYFKNIKKSPHDLIYPKEFNRRFIQRIIENRPTLKDKILKNYLKIFVI